MDPACDGEPVSNGHPIAFSIDGSDAANKMTEHQLAAKLREMYDVGQRIGDSSLVLLFGVAYAEQLGNVSEVVRQCGIANSLSTEVNKGRRLAKIRDAEACPPKPRREGRGRMTVPVPRGCDSRRRDRWPRGTARFPRKWMEEGTERRAMAARA